MTQMTPIIGVSGFSEEPALTICNDVLQEMGSEPYNWKFNSVDAPTFVTVASTTNSIPPAQDYQLAITDIAWLEAAWRIDTLSTAIPQPLDNIEAVRVLRPTSSTDNPQKLAWMYENDDGGIARLWPMPSISKQWTIGFTYQRKIPLKMGLQENWAPFPDTMAWVFNKGFLAMAYKHANDSRYDEAYKEFVMAMRKSLGFNDSEGNAEGFTPDHGLFLG
jgi:hypothetical protein